MDLDYVEIGRNIKLHRVRQGLKQAVLAEQANVTTQHISHIECGTTRPSLPLLVHLSEILKVSLYDLLGNNVPERKDAELEKEFARLLASSTEHEKKLCYALCRSVIEHRNQ